VLTDSAGGAFSAQSFQTATGGNSYSIDGTAVIGLPSQVGYLITSTIVLDNVGREAEAGHLTVGSMGTRTGVERFEVTVNNNDNTSGAHTASGSWLSYMSSTNNQLREVTVKNDTVGIASPDYLYLGTNTDQNGNNLTTIQAGYTSQAAVAYDAAASFAPTFLNSDGLTDVRLFDASAMKGDVKVGASVTANTIVKYQDLMDSAAADKTDDIAFVYSTGDGNDSINLSIDGAVAASNSNINPGRHDFTFTVNGGAGNDSIKVQMTSDAGGAAAWYNNQKNNANVTINAGTGDDTVYKPGAGDVIFDLGTGNDTVYTDNTGAQAVAFNGGRATWVLNSSGNASGGVANVNDLQGQAKSTSFKAVNLNLTVTFLGLTSKVVVGDSGGAKLTGQTITDLTINQAIKDAINNNVTLNKLLVAEDSAGRSLVVRSLIDGTLATTDFAVSLSSDGLSTAQTAAAAVDSSCAIMTDTQAGYLGFAAGSLSGTVTTHAVTANARFDDKLGSDNTTTALSVATNTEGGNAVLEIHTISSVSAVTTIVNSGSDTFTSAGTLSVIADGTTYSVKVTTSSTVATAVEALNALGNNKVTFTAGADAGSSALDTIVVTSNTFGNKIATTSSFTALTTITGANSTSTSDNTITGGTGNDVIVLGTTSVTSSALSSNETVKFTAAFGNDTIVHFDYSGNGIDKLDFKSFLGTASTTLATSSGTQTDSLVTIVSGTTAPAPTEGTTALKSVFIVYSGTVGSVYSLVDGTGAADQVVTLVGTITLAGPTGWSNIVVGNLS
jgi:hypothetical protein